MQRPVLMATPASSGVCDWGRNHKRCKPQALLKVTGWQCKGSPRLTARRQHQCIQTPVWSPEPVAELIHLVPGQSVRDSTAGTGRAARDGPAPRSGTRARPPAVGWSFSSPLGFRCSTEDSPRAFLCESPCVSPLRSVTAMRYV